MKSRKEKKVTFEDDMPNMKTEMNENLLTQKIEKRNLMLYSDQTVEFIYRVNGDLRKNTTEKGAISP